MEHNALGTTQPRRHEHSTHFMRICNKLKGGGKISLYHVRIEIIVQQMK